MEFKHKYSANTVVTLFSLYCATVPPKSKTKVKGIG